LRRSADTTPNSSETLRQIILKATPKAVLQQKLHEWSLMLQAPDSIEGNES
jgi:hypothetical protein